MAYDHNKPRTNKNNARQIAVDSEGLSPRRVALYITVPGVPDVKDSLASGLITNSTKIIAINHCRKERSSPYDRKIGEQIKRDLAKLGLQHVLVDDFFESDRGLRMVADAVKQFGKIDYAFLDLCGLATPSFCSAVNKLQNLLAEKARIAITVCTRVRRPQLITRWQEVFQGELDSPALRILSTSISSEWLGELFGNFSCTTKADIAAREKIIKHINNFLWQVQAIVASFDRYVTQVQSAMQYRDLTSMGLVVFNVAYQDGGNQLFHYIKDAYHNAKKPAPKGNPSLTPGKKAWVTRRKNILNERMGVRNGVKND